MTALLKKAGLKDTQPRRMVLETLAHMGKPASPYDVQRRLTQDKKPLNPVTIYRVLHALEEVQLVHRHPCNGQFTLCALPGHKGHHGFLHCHVCGTVEEFHSEPLCKLENGIAHDKGFRPSIHMSEVIGICRACLS